jgi:hypothetical protein
MIINGYMIFVSEVPLFKEPVPIVKRIGRVVKPGDLYV